MSLIGQFGVGFYSAFMVAEKVEVLSCKAGESQGWRWVSDGRGEFTVEPLPETARGAQIIVHLREGETEATVRIDVDGRAKPQDLALTFRATGSLPSGGTAVTEATVPVKVSDGPCGPPVVKPEFDVCAELAREAGVNVREVIEAALAAATRP